MLHASFVKIDMAVCSCHSIQLYSYHKLLLFQLLNNLCPQTLNQGEEKLPKTLLTGGKAESFREGDASA